MAGLRGAVAPRLCAVSRSSANTAVVRAAHRPGPNPAGVFS